MAAANWKNSQGIAASLGKRIVNRIWTSSLPVRSSTSSSLRRAAHTSAYDKNLDDHVRPTIVPDDVNNPESDKYWSPHPQTGIFGPATDHTHAAGDASAPASNGQGSVLEENAWFRPTSLEDLEKPHHA